MTIMKIMTVMTIITIMKIMTIMTIITIMTIMKIMTIMAIMTIMMILMIMTTLMILTIFTILPIQLILPILKNLTRKTIWIFQATQEHSTYKKRKTIKYYSALVFHVSDYSDVPLVEEGYQYKTHSVVLAASGKATTFLQNTLPSPNTLIYLTDMIVSISSPCNHYDTMKIIFFVEKLN